METVATPFIGDAECGPISANPSQMSKWSKKPRTILILSILFLASLVGALDSTIVTTLTHTIMSDLESPSVVSWLGVSYLIATALVQPLCAFLLGNVACSVAGSLAFLVVGRALSGIGGGMLTIMATIVLTDITQPEARGLWQGINNIVFGFGHGSGGLFGGLVAHRWSWRVAFMSLSVPTILIILGATLLPEPVRRHNQITTIAYVAEEPTATGNEDVPTRVIIGIEPAVRARQLKPGSKAGFIRICDFFHYAYRLHVPQRLHDTRCPFTRQAPD
ncbi:hypothetical protein FGADI_12204 [Fusarium gaditjirri]|uniref:Major facilitator superfamily (MFS) profile domain-containing protein n=1 Tax=Fusarium gaditjirri TaxID=282569 RepID=A0A8H4SSZ2_9HYPO|nr:hypothetical protein FGADI_12204 [Fusarium gaditjirri]